MQVIGQDDSGLDGKSTVMPEAADNRPQEISVVDQIALAPVAPRDREEAAGIADAAAMLAGKSDRSYRNINRCVTFGGECKFVGE